MEGKNAIEDEEDIRAMRDGEVSEWHGGIDKGGLCE